MLPMMMCYRFGCKRTGDFTLTWLQNFQNRQTEQVCQYHAQISERFATIRRAA